MLVTEDDFVKIPITIGLILREYRKMAGMTQKQLAKRVGVSRTMLAAYEVNKYIPPLELLRKVAHSLKMPHEAREVLYRL